MDDCKWNEEIRLLRPQIPNIATGFLNGGAEEGILLLHFYPGRLFRIVFRILKDLFPSAKESKGGLKSRGLTFQKMDSGTRKMFLP